MGAGGVRARFAVCGVCLQPSGPGCLTACVLCDNAGAAGYSLSRHVLVKSESKQQSGPRCVGKQFMQTVTSLGPHTHTRTHTDTPQHTHTHTHTQIHNTHIHTHTHTAIHTRARGHTHTHPPMGGREETRNLTPITPEDAESPGAADLWR